MVRLHIKVLQTLRVFAARGAIDIKVLKDLKPAKISYQLHGEGQVPSCLNHDLQDSRICRIFSLAAAKPLLKKRLFRSFRTYMSIETRVSPFSRSVRTLITCEPCGAAAH